ncbi:pyridoxamine 5'-phosphate oxidase family protein [Pseudonocardia kunmingensis]|uniref:Nitroimidazol reductase NimA-like FMN-containing flavoprotein (Pyridoxamine 5'-phosphate oxidase superfamily) n=1 Tax=Pseudonocardia kunmingensis TaxID=630975 RepID=A0A543E1C1_9PSEU|nr:pyridoxamine 5'-phosphate oxidase family protein [Pseudonocardia kunmingensis]TQM15249.1 nitroimidazol reductase NimA-like FMN-containing flavoprotein (pyridoxamine 5'-phosphate oxidase superfamily) [Pseudonocardia kunmingensis]
MDRDQVIEVLERPIAQRLLGSGIPARLAYTGLDGGPRVVPVAFWWTGAEIVVCSLPTMAKVPALRRDPRVAVTIDTQGEWPPRVLLVRGTARIEHVDGVPDEYVAASRKITPAEVFPEWETGVRALYDEMVRIRVEPEWARLLDFETTIPQAVEDLVRAKSGQG